MDPIIASYAGDTNAANNSANLSGATNSNPAGTLQIDTTAPSGGTPDLVDASDSAGQPLGNEGLLPRCFPGG